MKNIWVPLSGAIAQQKTIDTIANNVANANTPGFKKDRLIFKEYLTSLDKGNDAPPLPNKEWSPSDFYHSYGAENSYVKVDGSYTDHNQGQLNPTGNPLDLSINGRGFFEILTPNGIRFTRKGTFTLNKSNELVTDLGHRVLSKINVPTTPEEIENSPPLPKPSERVIKIPEGRFVVSNKGEIFVSGKRINDLSIIEFNDLGALKKEGNSYYINSADKNILPTSEKSFVSQGFIEESNVNAVEEMAHLIKANRQFESIQRAMKAYDHIAGKGVNEISRF